MIKIKNYIVVILVLSIGKINAQNLKGLWVNIDEASIYQLYINNNAYYSILIKQNGFVTGIENEKYKNICGFYNDRFLPSIDSLKTEGNYYFEVTTDDFVPENKESKGYYRGIIAYAMEFDDSRNEFLMYDIMRPGQQAHYKRVRKLPKNIENYLKSKGIKIELPTNNKESIIQIPKSTIYKTPNNPTKMYLLKGDSVEVLAEKDGWLHIRYYGKKTIEGWIKKTDVSN